MRHRAGIFLMLIGLLLAGLATLLVISIARQAAEASRTSIRQVAVVATTRDVPDQTLITADALVVKPFPAEFVPAGALASADQVVGKFANGFIAKDQLVVAGQVAPTRRSANLSDRVMPGKVVIWLPVPDLIALANIVRPGDRVDILLSIGVAGDDPAAKSNIATQTTIQNVEVFSLGQDEAARAAVATAAAPPTTTETVTGGPGQTTVTRPQPAVITRSMAFLVDHQDAVIIKFIKDSGGIIDMVVRSTEEQQIVRTDAMTLDGLAERFRFRVPQPILARGSQP